MPRRESLIQLVKEDYSSNRELLNSATGTVGTSRALGFTLIGALIGFGVTQSSWPLLLIGASVALFCYIVDGYYTWRAEALDKHGRDLEEILYHHYKVV